MFSSSEDESEGSSFSRIVVWNTLMSQEMIFLRLVSGNDTELVKKTNRRATTKSFFEIGSDFFFRGTFTTFMGATRSFSPPPGITE
jgi:hypothetical protein